MLTQETKRKIDSARNILVGKVPDPKAQVEQITTALIYKFMDDMDKEAIELGGKARFFTKGFEKYAWTKLLDQKLGGHERLELYGEAVAKMSQNPYIPQLFRDIFKDAFLPYRSPETLTLFLKEINGFTYDHSEDLGNAFEYLLSILGSQGDAGQFRTPRHIIDFIVEVIDPKKGDTILDPACGTAGFLISAYKHIIKEQKNKPLTPDEKKKLMNNLVGYDISPDMVKLSKVNMYLHDFAEPKIFEYDTLSSEEKWDEMYDVVMANPPFMSPSGGIRPHKRFSVQANRSEVLFVDYIKEHLRPNGRAGIIVPEGIIFQSAGAHKQLRKMLVEDGLFAVVSLPQGVFNPYAGVKTSILFFDNSLAKKTDDILFVKINNDGFDLGAQRREIEKNDIPEVINILNKWKNGEKVENNLAVYVEKTKIAESGDYNLSVDRYRVAIDYSNAKWPMVKLTEICDIKTGKKDVNQGNPNGKYPFFTCAKEHTFSDEFSFDTEAILVAGNGDVGAVNYFKGKFEAYQRTYVLMNFKNINIRYLFFVLNNSLKETVSKQKLGNTMPYIKLGMLQDFEIPLPPLEIQAQIEKELVEYQNIINGAKQIVSSWKPSFVVNQKWNKVKLEDIATLITKGTTPTTNGFKFEEKGINFIKVESISENSEIDLKKVSFISKDCHNSLKRSQLESNDILFSIAGTEMGISALVTQDILPANTNQALAIIRLKNDVEPKYVLNYLRSAYIKNQIENIKVGVAQFNLSLKQISEIEIPLPSIKIQEQIVEKIEAESGLVESSKKLIDIYEQKTKETISKLWNE